MTDRNMTRVTIKDIAEAAGVSITAVSFAFNDPGRLSEATVQRILEVAEQQGYVPDPIARSMKNGRTGALGILLPQPIPEVIRNPFLPEFLEGVGEVCTGRGFSLMLVPPLMGSVERAISHAAVDGFLTLGLELFKSTMMVLRRRRAPFVMVDGDPVDDVPAVNVDDEAGAHAIMSHVLAQGHRHITILAIRSGKEGRYTEYHGTLRRRMAGYLSALDDVGLTMEDPGLQLLECSSTARGGREALRQILQQGPRPSAIVAMSDIMAVGVIEEARTAGLNVPHDLSVAGFDDIPIAALVNPPLTTVSQPLREKGKLAANLLVNAIDGKDKHAHHLLPTTLITRASTHPPP